VDGLKETIPTIANKPIENNDSCLELCLDFVCTNLNRKKGKSQLNGTPHISCSFYVPENNSKETSTITIYVKDNEINREALASFYDGVDTAIHL